MAEMDDYVNQLLELKKKNPEQYNATLEQYRTQYPSFYDKLMPLLEAHEVVMKGQSKSSRFKDFVKDYWPYLIAIIAGSVTIIILLLMIILRV